MRQVVYGDGAQADMRELFDWIADRAGVRVAENYTNRIRAFCRRLDLFPIRGTSRDDLAPGLRTVGWRKRATVAFLVEDERVIIVRVLRKGMSLEKRQTNY